MNETGEKYLFVFFCFTPSREKSKNEKKEVRLKKSIRLAFNTWESHSPADGFIISGKWAKPLFRKKKKSWRETKVKKRKVICRICTHKLGAFDMYLEETSEKNFAYTQKTTKGLWEFNKHFNSCRWTGSFWFLEQPFLIYYEINKAKRRDNKLT